MKRKMYEPTHDSSDPGTSMIYVHHPDKSMTYGGPFSGLENRLRTGRLGGPTYGRPGPAPSIADRVLMRITITFNIFIAVVITIVIACVIAVAIAIAVTIAVTIAIAITIALVLAG